MTARLWVLDGSDLHRSEVSAASLDALSLDLPEGAYTTMRTYLGARVVGLSEHLRRLTESLALLGSSRRLDLGPVRASLAEVIHREARPDVRIRITAPLVGEAVFLACEPWEQYPPELYSKGVRCATTDLARERPLAKTTAFIASSRAAKERARAEIHELIRMDPDCLLLEGITSSFFAVLDGTLRTAGIGVLAGVTRGVVLKIAAELLPVVVEPARHGDLSRVSEAFITSATREVVPVVGIDSLVIGDGSPGPVSGELLRRFRAHLDEIAEIP